MESKREKYLAEFKNRKSHAWFAIFWWSSINL